MDKFLKRKSVSDLPPPTQNKYDHNLSEPISKKSHLEVDPSNLPTDPGLRLRISDYHPNDQEVIRRAYLQRGPCQPINYTFPQKKIGGALRRFNVAWFTQYKSWLEYSITKDAVFCLHCYLFRSVGEQGGGDYFVGEGFSNWKKKKGLETHVGKPNSLHAQAYMKSQSLMNQKHHIQSFLSKQSDTEKMEYQVHLSASVDCIWFLLRQGLAFRGDDESINSINHEIFLELLQYTANHNEDIKSVVLKNAPENHKLTALDIQKVITRAAACETTLAILKDLGDALFAVLIDESHDISVKEQMVVVLRYVNKKGCIVERFLGIMHVSETKAISLKIALVNMFSNHRLNITRLRGQGYDGANNMQGKFNELKSLILKENKSAFYVHCFAHQLQLALVHVAKNHPQIALLFNLVSSAVNIVAPSCKRQEIFRDKQAVKILEKLNSGELSSGQGLNQETNIKRPGDTRWGSYYKTLISLLLNFSSVIDVLQIVVKHGLNSDQKGETYALLDSMQSFEFIFSLHLMKDILAINWDLSIALQRKDQDIVNAMTLVKISKQRLQMMREDGWDILVDNVASFCAKHDIVVLEMDDTFIQRGISRCNTEKLTNLYHYRVELFYTSIDMQLHELNSRFDEVNTELLLCMTCLNPNDSFSAFDSQRLIRLAQFYPDDFSDVDLMVLHDQLETYVIDMRSNNEFSNVNGLSGLAKKMVETKKKFVYPMIYLLITLSLILPVATASVERAFSAMNIVKSRLRNRMGDDWMNDCLVTYIEKEVFDGIDNETIMKRFQGMKMRRSQL